MKRGRTDDEKRADARERQRRSRSNRSELSSIVEESTRRQEEAGRRQEQRANLSPTTQASINERDAASHELQRANLTPTTQASINERDAASHALRRANLTPTTQASIDEQNAASHALRRANLTPTTQASINERDAASHALRRSFLSGEERAFLQVEDTVRHSQVRAALTEEEEDNLLSIRRSYYPMTREQNATRRAEQRAQLSAEDQAFIHEQDAIRHSQLREEFTPEEEEELLATRRLYYSLNQEQNAIRRAEQRAELSAEDQAVTREQDAFRHSQHREDLTQEEQSVILQQQRLRYHGWDGDSDDAMDMEAIPLGDEGEAMMVARHHSQSQEAVVFPDGMIRGDHLTPREQLHNNAIASPQSDAEAVADGLSPLARQLKATTLAVKQERRLLLTNTDALRGAGCAVRYTIDDFREDDVSEHYCGKMCHSCPYCGARFWALESLKSGEFTRCCKRGTIKLPPLHPPTPRAKELLLANSSDLKKMKSRLRAINTNVSFSSIQMNDRNIAGRPSVPFFRMQGTSVHSIGALLPAPGVTPSFMQCFFHENVTGVTDRTNQLTLAEIGVLQSIHDEVKENNPFYHQLKSIMETNVPRDSPAYHIVMSDVPPAHALGPRTYNAPTAIEVGGIIFGEPGVSNPRQVTIQSRSLPPPNHLQFISSKHSSYDALSYTLLHMRGDQGWRMGLHTHTLIADAWQEHPSNVVSVLDFCRYRAHCRDPLWIGNDAAPYDIDQDVLFRGGLLTHQYWVDQYVKVEENNLDFLRFNQNKLKAAQYSGLADAVRAGEERQEGRYVVLPSTHMGAPRQQNERFQDAMARVRKYGKPTLFVTITCNPKWTEIQEELQAGEDAWMRPDLTARVFKMKLDAIMEDLTKNGYMGRAVSHIQVIEFQKRGLPHAHLLLRLATEDIPTVDHFDKYVCAEIPNPDTHPRLYSNVTSNMLHGPCDVRCKSETGECNKHFPKPASDTTISRQGEYPIYRRRQQHSHKKFDRDGHLISEQTDLYVVPYNMYLSLRYNCHINVEMVTTVSVVKYLYKYVYKGPDRASVRVAEVVTDPTAPVVIDEIQQFVDARYLSASESFWHLFGFPMQSCYPPVQALQLHLQDHHRVLYQEGDEAAALNAVPNTTLTNYFTTVVQETATPLLPNVLGAYPPAPELLYTDMPTYYTWSAKNGWQRRKRPKKSDIIGRMFTAHVSSGERSYMRKLLLTTYGATSFEYLRTIDGVVLPTYKEACLARGLLLDDQEWKECLHEAGLTLMPKPLRALFVTILVHNEPSSPADLWNLEVDGSLLHVLMAHDIYRNRTGLTTYEEVSENDIAITFHTIDDMIRDVTKNEKSIIDFAICHEPPARPIHMGDEVTLNRLLQAELHYEADEQREAYLSNHDAFNQGQRIVFDTITDDCIQYSRSNTDAESNPLPHIFFIDAPGGTGKTFVLNTLAAYFRSQEKVALCNASSGIAAILLHGGRTAHSRFKIPLKVLPDTDCSITARSNAGKAIIAADVIIWDESPMISKTVFASVDRLLQNLMNNGAPFGGKIMIFSGDFRQCLPIVPKQGRPGITSQVMKLCPWWSEVKQLRLHENERLKRYGVNAANTRLADFLMAVGNGTVPPSALGCIRIPDEYVFPSDSIEEFIDWAFPDLAQGDVNSSSSVIAPLNRDVDTVNELCLTKMTPTIPAVVLASSDEVVVEDDPIEVQHFQEEYLNTITLPGLPPHLLHLKVHTPVVLLRNLDFSNGLCNGTRLQVTAISNRLLTCRVLNGPNENDIVTIPRIDLNTPEGLLPFTMRRRQFPVKVAFAMTINKAQGQSFQSVGIYLSRPVFGHGQLYVALSRAGIAAKTKLFVENVPNLQGKFPGCEGTYTKNVVYQEVLTNS
jgi:hypothetical protein